MEIGRWSETGGMPRPSFGTADDAHKTVIKSGNRDRMPIVQAPSGGGGYTLPV